MLKLVGSSTQCFETVLRDGASRLLGMRRKALVRVRLHPEGAAQSACVSKAKKPAARLFQQPARPSVTKEFSEPIQ